jgi:hypothetical protein
LGGDLFLIDLVCFRGRVQKDPELSFRVLIARKNYTARSTLPLRRQRVQT